MPEENSAAEEHAIIQEVTAPLSTLPENAVPEVADVEFPVAIRGYDRLAVDAYVKRTSQLVAELQATRSPEAAVRRALERVGEEVSGILQRAHEAAAQITAHSRSEAEDRLEMARQEATEITAGARQRIKDLDAEADRIWAERQRIVEDTQDLARQLLALSEAAADRFPPAEDSEELQAQRPVVEPPLGATLNGDDVHHHETPWPAPAGGEGGEDSWPAPASGEGGEDSWPAPATGEGEDDPWSAPATGEGENGPFDGDQTVIMPPVKPDDSQDI